VREGDEEQEEQRTTGQMICEGAEESCSDVGGAVQELVRKGAEIESESPDGSSDPATYFYDL
jgi:hypothetical protein